MMEPPDPRTKGESRLGRATSLSSECDDCTKVSGVSIVGGSHVANGSGGHDWHGAVVTKDLIVLAVADGAGSAPHGDLGAQAAVRAIEEHDWRDLRNSCSPGRLRRRVLLAFHRAAASVRRQALEAGLEPRAYATTLLVVAATAEFVVGVQVGDGLAVLESEKGHCGVLLEPRGGEFANETTFLTSERLRERTQVTSHLGAWRSIALQTDGLQWVTYHAGERRLFAPFYLAIFDYVQQHELGDGTIQFLVDLLESDRIQERCSDDLTLLITVRDAEVSLA